MSEKTPVKSVTGRVLSILAVFEGSLAPRSLTEVSAETGLALSTAHRLLAELEEWGAVQRDDNGRYQIGLRLWELGQHAGSQVRELSRPLLQDLYTLTRETVHLAIRDGGEVLYIDRVYGTRRVPKTSRVGGRLPLHATAVGKVLLAFEEDWVRDALIAQPLSARTPRTVTDPAALRAELEQIRHAGYSLTVDEVTLGSASIAVPVMQSGGGVGAALGLVVTTDLAGTLAGHLPAMRGIAAQITKRVGRYPLRSMRPGGVAAPAAD
ncbi:IclR family transcriptional regulator [Microbacterium gorillae]|uniref:IclR family transcriptional regulator n=1 Tax=Microbacterium gorillae TaxID=1231063 RepID=UPI000A673AA8|nr:IclR family transcriptional regulator [Microbacterium gorillae]